MKWVALTGRLSVICWRLFAQLRVLRSYDPRSDDPAKAAEFVDALIALGPTFVKLGQILSTRPDILPAAYIAALERLQERGPVVPFTVIQATIETELGAPLSEHFATCHPEPMAAASLAQVHRGTLMDGTVVAINVQCPNMEVLIARDLDALSFGIAILGRIAPRKPRRSNLAAFFAEFQRYTHTELDFRAEAQMMTRLGQNFIGHDVVIIPKNYPALKTRRILTMDRVATKSLRQDLLAQVEAGHAIVFRIGWSIYELMCEIPLMQAKTLTKNPQKKMRIATDMFRQFPFRSPEYGWRDVAADPGVVAFDCTQCPVAAFFIKQDAPELCVRTWCALDYPLAQKWGGRFERSDTLAMGKDHCDFHWHIDLARSEIQQTPKANT